MLILTKIKLIVIAILLISTITLGYLYRNEIKNAALIAQELMQTREILSETKEKLEEEKLIRKRVEKILYSREEAYKKLQKESLALRNDLEELRQIDEETNAWANEPIPIVIRNRLLIKETLDKD